MVNPFAIGSWESSFNLIIMTGLFFISAILGKQLSDYTEFSTIGGSVLGIAGFIVMMFIFSNQKWAFLVGLICMIIGGFLGASIIGGGSEE